LFRVSFKAGDEIITMDDLYGGTYRMFTKIYNNSGIKFMNNLENVQSLINENPLMKTPKHYDIAAKNWQIIFCLPLIILLQHRICKTVRFGWM
jgi:cystathionine beta-lyase/cystathionine gamma-synthase